MWLRSILFSVVLYFFCFLYNVAYRQGVIVDSLSEALAATGGFLLGFSFGLSSMSYFFNFLDFGLKYRKDLGLLGYYLALFYAVTLVFRFPDLYGYGIWERVFTIDVVFGVSAMVILTYMALISNSYGMKVLGTLWRPSLRLGYVAYVLLTIRAIFLESDIWYEWVLSPLQLPPPRLILSLFAWVVILTRIVMQMWLSMEKSESALPENGN